MKPFGGLTPTRKEKKKKKMRTVGQSGQYDAGIWGGALQVTQILIFHFHLIGDGKEL